MLHRRAPQGRRRHAYYRRPRTARAATRDLHARRRRHRGGAARRPRHRFETSPPAYADVTRFRLLGLSSPRTWNFRVGRAAAAIASGALADGFTGYGT